MEVDAANVAARESGGSGGVRTTAIGQRVITGGSTIPCDISLVNGQRIDLRDVGWVRPHRGRIGVRAWGQTVGNEIDRNIVGAKHRLPEAAAARALDPERDARAFPA